MPATDAVRSTAVARREVRNSLDRLDYHLGRGTKGAKGVAREVRFLDALHKQTVRLSGTTVNAAYTANAVQSFGGKAASALSTGNASRVGRMKSSILADFSADSLQPVRDQAGQLGRWKWTANASACPSCLSRHGQVNVGGLFTPMHPSCLCIPQPIDTPGLRTLSDSELVDMQRQYGDPRYAYQIEKFSKGEISRVQLAQVEAVNARAPGLKAVGEHLAKQEVSQTGLTAGVAPDSPVPEPDLFKLKRKTADPDIDSTSEAFHRKGGEWSAERTKLHDDIVETFLKEANPVDDPEFYMTGGGPASGKSTMLEANAKRYPKNMVQVDADEIKKLLPEYESMTAAGNSEAAAFVHSESSYISGRILEEAAQRNLNVLYDTVGDSGLSGLRKKVATARNRGRTVSVDYASNDLNLALELAEKRAKETGRLVPDHVIRGGHSDVTDTFLRAIAEGDIFDTARLWDTNIYQKPRLVATYTKGGKLKVKNWELFEDFVSKGSRDWDEVIKDLGLRGPRKPKIPQPTAVLDDDAVRFFDNTLRNNLQEDSNVWWRNLNRSEKDAVTGYTGSDYDPINRNLLDRLFGSEVDRAEGYTEQAQKMRTVLDKYDDTQLSPDVTWRRVNGSANFDDDLAAGLASGSDVTHVPFASSSIDPGVGLRGNSYTFLEIQSNSCAYIGQHSQYANEMEWLIPDGLKFRVIGKKEVRTFTRDPANFVREYGDKLGDLETYRTVIGETAYRIPDGYDMADALRRLADELPDEFITKTVWQLQEVS